MRPLLVLVALKFTPVLLMTLTYRLYSYELQVVQGVQRGGIGKTLVHCLCDIAREWDMQKFMLTVFKGDEIQLSVIPLVMFKK